MGPFFSRHFRRKKKRFTKDQIGTYFTHKRRKKKHFKRRKKNHVSEIGRTSHRDRFGDHVLVRRRVVSNFFFSLPSVVFFKHSVVLFARESSPDASSSIAQIVSRSPIFYTIVLCWNKDDARKKLRNKEGHVDDRKRS